MMTRATGIVLLASSASALAQQTLGDLLDAGAVQLSPLQFQQDVVGRTVHGPMETGMESIVTYTRGGVVEGTGWPPGFGASIAWTAEILGEWVTEQDGRVCITISLNGATIRVKHPPRCRYWFKMGDRYYVTGSVDDRAAPALARTVDTPSTDAAAAPG